MLLTAKLRGEVLQIQFELEPFSRLSILLPLPAALQAHLRNTLELNQGPLCFLLKVPSRLIRSGRDHSHHSPNSVDTCVPASSQAKGTHLWKMIPVPGAQWGKWGKLPTMLKHRVFRKTSWTKPPESEVHRVVTSRIPAQGNSKATGARGSPRALSDAGFVLTEAQKWYASCFKLPC